MGDAGVPAMLRVQDAPSFFAATPWTIDRVVTAPDLEREHMAGTVLAGQLKTGAFQVTAGT